MRRIRLSVLAVLLLLGAGLAGRAAAEEEALDSPVPGSDIAPARNEVYIEECGACHVAFPPGLMPQRSWEVIVDGFADHFGEELEFDDEVIASLRKYLINNAADRSKYPRSVLIMQYLRDDLTPTRVMDVPYIKRKHSQIPRDALEKNANVRSFANCDACHSRVEAGSFNKKEIKSIWSAPNRAGRQQR